MEVNFEHRSVPDLDSTTCTQSQTRSALFNGQVTASNFERQYSACRHPSERLNPWPENRESTSSWSRLFTHWLRADNVLLWMHPIHSDPMFSIASIESSLIASLSRPPLLSSNILAHSLHNPDLLSSLEETWTKKEHSEVQKSCQIKQTWKQIQDAAPDSYSVGQDECRNSNTKCL